MNKESDNQLKACCSMSISRAYVVLAASTLIHFLALFPYRISSIIYVACIERYDVSRAEAIYPLTINICIKSISGIMTTYLSSKIGGKATIILGGALSSLGIGACFFAEDILFVTISFGVVAGIGLSMNTSLIVHFLKPYFNENFGFACGFILNGSVFSRIVFAPVAEFLLKQYGLSGTFLLFGGIMLNTVPISMLIKVKQTNPSDKSQKTLCNQIIQSHKSTVKIKSIKYYENSISLESIPEKNTPSKFSSPRVSSNTEFLDSNNSSKKSESISSNCVESSFNSLHVLSNNKPLESVGDKSLGTNINYVLQNNRDPLVNFSQVNFSQILTNDSSENSDHNPGPTSKVHMNGESSGNAANVTDAPQNNNPFEDFSQMKVDPVPTTKPLDANDSSKNSDQNSGSMSNGELAANDALATEITDVSKNHNNPEDSSQMQILSGFLDPCFLLILLTASCFMYIYVVGFSIIIDVSREKGLPRENEIYLLTIGPIPDIITNILVGKIIDKRIVSNVKFTASLFLAYSAVCACLVWANSFLTYISGILLFGIITNGFLVMFPVLVYEFIDQKWQALAQSSKYMLYGALCFTASPLIGHFRDKLGAYSGVLYALSLTALACSLLITILPFLSKRKK